MATLTCDDGDLVLRLSRLERLGALHGDIRVALASVAGVAVSAEPFGELRGIRAPGTGIPRVIALGTWRTRPGRDFAALYRHRPAVIVQLRDAEFGRMLVSSGNAEAVAAAIRDAQARAR